jgi:tRNA(adenine34) deaminase
MDKIHQKWMKMALKEARSALDNKDFPIGAVIVQDKQIIAKGFNQIELLQDGTAHAEMIAITSASNFLKNWRLNDCDLYVTLEPCCMCAGAIMKSRIRNIFFGAYNKSEGCVSSLYNICNDPRFNHQSGIKGGILSDECSYLLHSFFEDNSIDLTR